MKMFSALLWIAGLIIMVVFVVKTAFLIHSYFGWIVIGSVCALLGSKWFKEFNETDKDNDTEYKRP